MMITRRKFSLIAGTALAVAATRGITPVLAVPESPVADGTRAG